jgi:prepilin-type N-terminal cleavage/methylation domain-containing protein
MTRIKSALERRLAGAKKDEGFSLIELLVVVIIIGILAAIAIPIYIGVQNNAKDSAVKTDLTNAKLATVAYFTENPTGTPVLASLGDGGYTKSENTSTIDYVGTPTSTSFCIAATGVTTNAFHISSDAGVGDGATC